VLKPFSPERLTATLERVRALLAAPHAGEAAALDRALETDGAATAPLRHLLVEHGSRSVFLHAERIDWAESDRNYVTLHAAGHTFTVRSTLQRLEARLDRARFLRINRAQIVRLEAVREVHPWSHGDRHVVMHDGNELIWSRRFRARDDGRFGLD
jgi:two-component system LytT family response regulator